MNESNEKQNKIINNTLGNEDKLQRYGRKISYDVLSPKMDAEEFKRRGKEMIDFVANYLENIEQLPVFPAVEPGYLHNQIPCAAPEKPHEWDDIMEDVKKVIIPGVTHWHHPHFHAYFPAANSYAALCGDMLSGGIGCIGFTWASSPVCTELEVVMMDWLAKMIDLPKHFLSQSGTGGGVIYNTCSEATLVALFAARNKSIDAYCHLNPGSNRYMVMSKLVGYYSDQAHSSVERAGLLSMIQMKPLKSRKRKMRGSDLSNMIKEDIANGLIPFYCVATLGTTGSCAFDALNEIGPICERYNIWLHVDAAYAGSSFICPEFRKYMDGIEYAMSFVFNPHKWLLVNFDCSAVWFKETIHVVETFTVDPEYLKHKKQGTSPDFRHWHIQLGRRFRSLKIWFVLRLYGVSGLQKYIRNHVQLAHLFEELLIMDDRMEIVEEVTMGLVCFRLKASNYINNLLYLKIEQDGRIHIVISKFVDTDILYLRFAVCYQFATEEHVKYAYNVIKEVVNSLQHK